MLRILARVLLKTVSLGLFLLALGCSNEPGSVNESSHGSSNSDEFGADKNGVGTVEGSIKGSMFNLLDADPVDLLTDERLQVINYWASWCLPCLEEMPELAAFREEYQEVVEVYAVNYDQLDVDQLREEIQALGVEIPALIQDPNERLGYERPSVLPTTVIMLKGEIKEVMVGPQTKETLKAVLDNWGV